MTKPQFRSKSGGSAISLGVTAADLAIQYGLTAAKVRSLLDYAHIEPATAPAGRRPATFDADEAACVIQGHLDRQARKGHEQSLEEWHEYARRGARAGKRKAERAR